MDFSIKNLIEQKDYNGLRQVLLKNPGLANEGISYDAVNTEKRTRCTEFAMLYF